MPDEEDFDHALKLAGNFNMTKCRVKIQHPDLPKIGNYLEVDNLTQKVSTLYVFEGKSKKENTAVKQLKLRLKSLILFREENISSKALQNYQSVRIFSYSFKRKSITEYDSKGKQISNAKFSDSNELAEILRKL